MKSPCIIKGYQWSLNVSGGRNCAPKRRGMLTVPQCGAALKNVNMDQNLLELVSHYPDLTISVKASDLITVNRQIFAEELEKLLAKSRDRPTLVDRQDAMRQLDASSTTLWRFQKLGLLTPIRIGNKARYKQSEIDAILNNQAEEGQ